MTARDIHADTGIAAGVRCGIPYARPMSGITFKTDSHGKKTAAVIDLRRHRKLWEDFYDTMLAESRAAEPRESLESVKRRLKMAAGRG